MNDILDLHVNLLDTFEALADEAEGKWCDPNTVRNAREALDKLRVLIGDEQEYQELLAKSDTPK